MSDLSYKYRGLSKHLSYLLRHHPEDADLVLDKRGFTDLEAVIDSLKNTKHSWASREDIEYLIENSEKKRFEIKDDMIRALYGHSIEVDIEEREEPPDILYHGTSPDSLTSIFEEGLKPMGRQYVHLSISEQEAIEVGKRHHPEPVILEIDASSASEDGIAFYKRGDLYLSEHISPKYIKSFRESIPED
ncbi:MAG: RNA 2'-phosphotransferase [Candidatus Thermoplasmatota archaeon]|nr:RNA 2'-phosphotransferase [Candidatus Thermoplasmatota archaeon]MBS3790724.1 RNA 2'-phosphotransferase [Candidatus Thermoplasmatota archaeon]